MGTPKIKWNEGASYHITVRGNHRNDIFRDEEDFQVYLTMLEESLIYYSNLASSRKSLTTGSDPCVNLDPCLNLPATSMALN